MEEGVQEQSFKGDVERTMTDAFSSKLIEVPCTFWKITLVSKWGIDRSWTKYTPYQVSRLRAGMVCTSSRIDHCGKVGLEGSSLKAGKISMRLL